MLTARMDWLEENAELARSIQAAWKEAVQVVVDSNYQLFLEEPYATFLDRESPEELKALADYCAQLPCYTDDWTQADVDQQMTYLQLLVDQGGLEALPETAPVAVLDQVAQG
jgi:NitT/TauT family transport system substrate-binding protein